MINKAGSRIFGGDNGNRRSRAIAFRVRSGAARRALEPVRVDHPRDDQHGHEGEPIERHQECARHVLRHPHLRSSPGLGRGGAADPCDGARADDPADHRAVRRHQGRRRLHQQQPVLRRHASRRPDAVRSRVLGGRAAVLDARPLAPRRHGRAGTHDLSALRGDHLSGRPAFPLHPHPGEGRGQSRHHPHGPPEDPRLQHLVWRLSRPGRRLPHRRAAAQGADRQVRRRDHQGLHRGLDGVWRAARHRCHPPAAGRHLFLSGLATIPCRRSPTRAFPSRRW